MSAAVVDAMAKSPKWNQYGALLIGGFSPSSIALGNHAAQSKTLAELAVPPSKEKRVGIVALLRFETKTTNIYIYIYIESSSSDGRTAARITLAAQRLQ